MLTDQIQFGVFHSISLVYRYTEIYNEMCKWWETTLRIQAVNRKGKTNA